MNFSFSSSISFGSDGGMVIRNGNQVIKMGGNGMMINNPGQQIIMTNNGIQIINDGANITVNSSSFNGGNINISTNFGPGDYYQDNQQEYGPDQHYSSDDSSNEAGDFDDGQMDDEEDYATYYQNQMQNEQAHYHQHQHNPYYSQGHYHGGHNHHHYHQHHGNVHYQHHNNMHNINIQMGEPYTMQQQQQPPPQKNGLTKAEINQLPISVYSSKKISKPPSKKVATKKEKPEKADMHNDECPSSNDSCAVCIVDYKHGDKLRTLPCLHKFHKECVDKWLKLKSDCPICKYNLLE